MFGERKQDTRFCTIFEVAQLQLDIPLHAVLARDGHMPNPIPITDVEHGQTRQDHSNVVWSVSM